MTSLLVRTKANLVNKVLANLPKRLFVFPSSPDPDGLSLGCFVASWKIVAYRWHNSLALESPSNSIIDSFWLAPIRCHTFESVALMSIEMFGVFLHDWNMLLCGDHLNVVSKGDYDSSL